MWDRHSVEWWMPWTIYCHMHVESGRRYIGMTMQTWQERWKKHCYAAKSTRDGRWHFPNAIRKYGPEAFSHEVLEVCGTLEEANLREKHWINLFDARDPARGFNLAEGGGSQPHPIRRNPWNRPEYRDKCLPSFIAATHTPEAYARMKATKNLPENLAEQSTRSKALAEDPAFRTASGEHANKGKPLSEEHRAKIGEKSRARSPELVERIAAKLRGRHHSEEHRAKISAANRKRSHSEETKRKIAESLARRRMEHV